MVQLLVSSGHLAAQIGKRLGGALEVLFVGDKLTVVLFQFGGAQFMSIDFGFDFSRRLVVIAISSVR